MTTTRRDLLIGGAASAFMPLRIGGQPARSLDGGITVDPPAGASSGPSAMTLTVERMTSTMIKINGTQPTGGVLVPPSGYGDLGYGYDYQVSFNSGPWIKVTEATWHKSRIVMVQGAPPGTPWTVQGRGVDAAGNAGPWATVSGTTPTYTALDRVLLTPLGGRPAYCCYMSDIGSAVATISTNVSGATFVAVQSNGYYDSQGASGSNLNSTVQYAPQFMISGGNQLVLSAAPTLGANWRGGTVGLTFEIQDASLNTYSLSCYITILCNNPMNVATAPVAGAGHIGVFSGGNLNGTLYIPNDLPLGMIVGTVDYMPLQNGVTGGLPNSWADVTQNPGFAFSVEYEQAQLASRPGGLIAKSGGVNRVRIKQTRPLAPGSYTLQIGIHTMAPSTWVGNTNFYAGDFIRVSSTNTALWQATSSSGVSSASLAASGLNITPTVGQVVTDHTVTWQCVALGGSNGGCLLPCLVTIPVVVPAAASKAITATPLWSGTLTSCNPPGGMHLAQVTGQGGFTPAYFTNLPDPSSVGGLMKYAIDAGGVLSIAPFCCVNQFDVSGYGFVTAVSGNTVTVGAGSYSPAWCGVISGGQTPAFGLNQFVSAPSLPPATTITNISGSVLTLSSSAASIPIGSVIRSDPAGVSNGCVLGALACGLDTVIIVALDSSGNVGWLQWNNYVAFPTPQPGYGEYVIGGPGAAPTANGYRQDSFDGLMADLQNEWNAWSTSGTLPPSRGCSIYVAPGVGENPDGSYTYYGQLSAGNNNQSSPPVPMKIIGTLSGGLLPKMRWPRLFGGSNVKSLFGNYWDLIFQGFYTDGAYEWWTGTTPNLDTFSQTNGGTGRVVIDLVFACAGDSFVQRGWNMTNQVECSNTVCCFFGSGDISPPLETFYSLGDSLLVSDVYIIGSNVGDVFKARCHAVFGDNLACLDGNELGGSKLIGAPSGAQWTFGKVTLHRSMQAGGGQVIICNNENWKESRIDQVFSVRDLTLVADVYYNTLADASAPQQLIVFGTAAWIGRGVPASMMIGNFNFWSPVYTGPAGHWSTITSVQTGQTAYPPWIQSEVNAGQFPSITLLDGVTPFTLPAMLSTRPDLSGFYQGTPMMQALGITLPTPSTPFSSRLMQTPSGGNAETFVGSWNEPLPLQDIYTTWSGNGATSYLGYGFEIKVPHAASGVVGQAMWLPNKIEISPQSPVAVGTSSINFPATGWREIMSMAGATPGVASSSWYTQNFAAGTTASYPQPTFSITGSSQIVSAGSGYPVSTTVSLTVSGGAFTTPAVLVWNTNSSGGIASLASVTTAGSYTLPADMPATCTGSTGSGFSFKPTWSNTGFSNTLTFSQPTISPAQTNLAPIQPVGAPTWNSVSGDFTFTESTGLAAGDVVKFLGWVPTALNGQQTVVSMSGTNPHFTIPYVSGGVVKNGFFVKLPVWELDGVPAADIAWSIAFINTNTGSASCFTINSSTGAITYTGGRAAGDWASVWVVATLYGTTYLSYNKVYFVTFT